MADDPTLSELARNVDRLERAQQQAAAEAVPAKLWAAEHQALQGALNEHTRQSGLDRARVERGLGDLRKAHDRDIASLRTDLDKEIAQARAENREQIAALKKERETSGMNAWQRFGIASAAVVGLLAVFVAFYVGTHK
jgi:uncharacterized membrane protein YccC